MGNITIAKEKLYSAIERSDENTICKIMEKFPEFKNQIITNDCKSTALGRAAYRGDLRIVEVLLGLGANIDFAGPRQITPLMWACRRGHLIVARFLVENGADVNLLSKEEFNVMEQCIIYGQYECGRYLLKKQPELKKTIKTPEQYRQFADETRFQWIDYKNFIDHLSNDIPIEQCPDFFNKPKPSPLVDPVIDPREPWKQWFSRVLEFEEPPMVERSELPQKLQPQNRFLGRLNSYLNGQSPYPSNYYENQQLDQFQQQEEEQKQFDNQQQQNIGDEMKQSSKTLPNNLNPQQINVQNPDYNKQEVIINQEKPNDQYDEQEEEEEKKEQNIQSKHNFIQEKQVIKEEILSKHTQQKVSDEKQLQQPKQQQQENSQKSNNNEDQEQDDETEEQIQIN